MQELLYDLKTKISYSNKGNQEEGSFIQLSPPTGKNIKECAFLKQAFFQALPKADAVTIESVTEKEENIDDVMTGEAVMMIISGSKDVLLSAVLAHARELFASGVAMIEGEVKLTKDLIDRMDLQDLEGMTGEYLSNFMLASSLNSLKKS